MGEVFYGDYLGFAKTKYFLGVLEIHGISRGNLSCQVRFGVQS